PKPWRGVLDTWALAMILLAGWGGWLMWRGRALRPPPFLWLWPLVLFVPVVLFLMTVRYRLPLDPFVLMLAAVALLHGRDRPPLGSAP
ncbi:MAG: hypothetical protein QOG68_2300, partial [Solirubrobacteraceae bacterium]|nr:hypothetical protein [Solirubrobacteraceae bacterium]